MPDHLRQTHVTVLGELATITPQGRGSARAAARRTYVRHGHHQRSRVENHLVQTFGYLFDRHAHVIDTEPPAPPGAGEAGMCGQNVPVRPSQSERDILHQLMHLAMGAGYQLPQ